MKAHKENQKYLIELAAQVASAVRRLAMAASHNFGSDCYLHAALGQALLADKGVAARIAIGSAAWRVGKGDGDVISHTAEEKSFLPPGVTNGLPFHAWLEIDAGEKRILDLTTYQLKRKAAELDAMDGGKTHVEWAPDFLFAKKLMVAPYRVVAQSYKTGVFFYEESAEIALKVQSSSHPLDPEDIENARLLMANPEMIAFGPNDFSA